MLLNISRVNNSLLYVDNLADQKPDLLTLLASDLHTNHFFYAYHTHYFINKMGLL